MARSHRRRPSKGLLLASVLDGAQYATLVAEASVTERFGSTAYSFAVVFAASFHGVEAAANVAVASKSGWRLAVAAAQSVER